MIVIIAGSRDLFVPVSVIEEAVAASNFEVHEIVSGGARGIDSCGELYAMEKNIKLTRFPIQDFEWREWEARGKTGANPGHARNEKMARYGEALIVVWKQQTPGTADMLRRARAHQLLSYIHRLP